MTEYRFPGDEMPERRSPEGVGRFARLLFDPKVIPGAHCSMAILRYSAGVRANETPEHFSSLPQNLCRRDGKREGFIINACFQHVARDRLFGAASLKGFAREGTAQKTRHHA
jgi:hypothetical protein